MKEKDGIEKLILSLDQDKSWVFAFCGKGLGTRSAGGKYRDEIREA
jgi:hypothetical protein